MPKILRIRRPGCLRELVIWPKACHLLRFILGQEGPKAVRTWQVLRAAWETQGRSVRVLSTRVRIAEPPAVLMGSRVAIATAVPRTDGLNSLHPDSCAFQTGSSVLAGARACSGHADCAPKATVCVSSLQLPLFSKKDEFSSCDSPCAVEPPLEKPSVEGISCCCCHPRGWVVPSLQCVLCSEVNPPPMCSFLLTFSYWKLFVVR